MALAQLGSQQNCQLSVALRLAVLMAVRYRQNFPREP